MAINQTYYIEAGEAAEGQRLDNFLFSRLKGLPKSRIYRAIRNGEIRVNQKRAKPDQRLRLSDKIRIPPFRLSEKLAKEPIVPSKLANLIEKSVIYEDKYLLIINKPAGIAVHGGSGISMGVIELMRRLRPRCAFLELVHRLDRETSGCLLLAKKSSILKELHQLLAERRVEKTYLALLKGHCRFSKKIVEAPLDKNVLQSGERMVRVSERGKPSKTIFRCLRHLGDFTLVEAQLETGRTHQIRVHAAFLGHPIIGDEKYGDEEWNKKVRQVVGKRLFLHAAAIQCELSNGIFIAVCASLDSVWIKTLLSLRREGNI